MSISFEFDYKKATQALNYISNKSGGKINKMKAIKLIWAADRYHLRKYGRPVTNDSYVAMGYGPVGSKTKDIAEFTDFLDETEKEYCKDYITKKGLFISSTKEVDMELFSKSDIEALNFSFEMLGKFDAFELANISHAYPEWKRHKKAIENVGQTSIRMYYEDFLNDPDINEPEIQKYLQGIDVFAMADDEKTAIKEYIEEQQHIKRLWR